MHALVRQASARRPPLRDGCIDRASRDGGRHLPQVRVRHGGREVLLDDVLGYRFALVVRAEALTAGRLDWAAARDIRVVRPGVDFVEVDGHLARFLRERGLDFALVRPDRQIFGAGAAADLPRVADALDAGLGVAAA